MQKKFWPRFRRLFLQLVLLFFVSTFGTVFFYRFVPVYFTPLMFIRSIESIGQDKFVGMNKTWVSMEDIHPSMQKAVLKAEDYRFFEHNGFDYEAIEKAMKYNQTHKKKKGASTISQQTAKNVFLWPRRDYFRKGLEAYFTVLIEFMWPKERIMEVYLNVIELGSGVYGVEAASQKFFKKSAKTLTASQASLIAAVLPNPRKFRIDRPSAYVTSRQHKILFRVSPEIPRVEEPTTDLFDIKFDNGDDEKDTKDDDDN